MDNKYNGKKFKPNRKLFKNKLFAIKRIKNNLLNNNGLTLVEVIMTLAILGAVICPIMNMFVLSQKINSESKIEYMSIQTAQYYMEEVRSMDGIAGGIIGNYSYNNSAGYYERSVADGDYTVEIKIIPGSYGLHYIEINVLNEGRIINNLNGSIIFK